VFRATRSLLTALVSTTVVITGVLVWGGWRLLDQQRAIDEQRARDQAESAADAIAAGIREKLAEAGERLSGWVSNPTAPVPAIDGAIVVTVRPGVIELNPPGGLPFVPAPQPARQVDRFAALESIEFGADRPERAIDAYRALTRDVEPYIRAGALLRLGRMQRKIGDVAGALVTYRQLAALGTVQTDDLPAELVGLDGQRSIHLAGGRRDQADDIARQILRGLDEGRWLIARGTAEFYRERYPEARPQSWQLANALSELWRETDGRPSSRGQRVFGRDSVLVLWRSNGIVTAALAAAPDRFLALPHTPAVWQLRDPEGHVIAGPATVAARSVARIIGGADYAWTLHASPAAAGRRGSRTILIAMMGAMLAFVWGASYFMARAITREAAVARLQSDFVAAVSHEFRSPLTSVRQMAEMLQADRVTTDDRRRMYYRILAGEAARLQRLVETLLNFGKMEAGAERYRFIDCDAGAVVREVVESIEPQARESGKAIQIEAPDVAVRVRADEGALAVALRNLIDNAIKYSPDNSMVRVQWHQHADRAAICVIDRGVGIPRAEQRAIFRKFVRGRGAIEANITGTGVGLSMVQQIVAAHGGEVHLDSEPGRGSTFTITLPAATAS
jgi:signal transduction histidine kinase